MSVFVDLFHRAHRLFTTPKTPPSEAEILRDQKMALLEGCLPLLPEDDQTYFKKHVLSVPNADWADVLNCVTAQTAVRIYHALTDYTSPHPDRTDFSSDVIFSFFSDMGSRVDLSNPFAAKVAMNLAIGRDELRPQQPIPKNNTFRFDGTLTYAERENQHWLANTLLHHLPSALEARLGENKSDQGRLDDFVRNHLSGKERGKALALLCVGDNITADEAYRTLAKAPMTVEVWDEFILTCRSLKDFTPPSLENGVDPNTPMLRATQALTDGIVAREIAALTPKEIEALDDKTAENYIKALMGNHGVSVTPIFEITRDYFYKHLPVPKALADLRKEQTDTLTELCLSTNESTLRELSQIKNTWFSLSLRNQEIFAQHITGQMAFAFQTPHVPTVVVKKDSSSDAPQKTSSTIASYCAFEGGVWANRITLRAKETPTHPCGHSLRPFYDFLSDCAHELLHADSEQRNLRTFSFSGPQKMAFAAWANGRPVTTNRAIQMTNTDDKLSSATLILNPDILNVRRGAYISASKDPVAYECQPEEKQAYKFQHAYAGTIYGAITEWECEKGGRNLPQQLAQLYKDTKESLAQEMPEAFLDALTASQHNMEEIATRGTPLSPHELYQTAEDLRKICGKLLTHLETLPPEEDVRTQSILTIGQKCRTASDEIYGYCIIKKHREIRAQAPSAAPPKMTP